MTSLMTSSGPQINQNFQLAYLRYYFSKSIDQILNMSEMVMAILLAYSNSCITSGKEVCNNKMPFEKCQNIKHSFNLTSDVRRYSHVMPKKILHDDDVINEVIGWPEICTLYSCSGEFGSVSKVSLSSMKTNIVVVFLGYTCMKMILINTSRSQAY